MDQGLHVRTARALVILRCRPDQIVFRKVLGKCRSLASVTEVRRKSLTVVDDGVALLWRILFLITAPQHPSSLWRRDGSGTYQVQRAATGVSLEPDALSLRVGHLFVPGPWFVWAEPTQQPWSNLDSQTRARLGGTSVASLRFFPRSAASRYGGGR